MLGDEAELYERLAPRVERIVRSEVHAPREVVEDACHHAWAQLINHSERIERDTALSWLVRTAVRHAWRLDHIGRREASLEAVADSGGELPLPSKLPGPAERAELRDKLGVLGALSDRQRRLVWLQAAGLSYVEMSAYTGDSVRTVERQIVRATARIRELHREGSARDAAHESPAMSVAPRKSERRQRSLEERGLER